jgi:RNA polymerase sigma-70 factor (ECF subfamily)
LPRRERARFLRVTEARGTDAEPETDAEARRRLELLYREQAPRLRRRIKAQLQSNEEAGDLVQDAFARLLGSGARHALRTPEAFLNRILRNLLIDRARRLANRSIHEPIDALNEPMIAPAQSDAMELTQMRERYRSAVAALPARMREVFVLHRVEGLGYKQIAEQLGISNRTVEWHVAEAIVRIGKALDQ